MSGKIQLNPIPWAASLFQLPASVVLLHLVISVLIYMGCFTQHNKEWRLYVSIMIPFSFGDCASLLSISGCQPSETVSYHLGHVNSFIKKKKSKKSKPSRKITFLPQMKATRVKTVRCKYSEESLTVWDGEPQTLPPSLYVMQKGTVTFSHQ